MPTITLPISSGGLVVEVGVWISAPRRAQMFRLGLPVPPAVRANFLIDTGADTTMVHDQTMRSLGLTPTGQARVLGSTSNGVSNLCDVHDIELQILDRSGTPWWTIGPLETIARPLLNHSIEGMIGRDVLSRAILMVDGPARRFTLSY